MLPVLFLALAVLQEPQVQWPTLAEVLADRYVPVEGLPDAARRITSYAVLQDDRWVAIAYYWYGGTDVLPPELRIRAFDRRTKRWRSTILRRGDKDEIGGSADGFARRGRWFYLDTHLTPSAGILLVLAPDLMVRKRLAGWSSLILPDGRVAYEHSMTHFAPVHPGSISLYDPNTDCDVRLYPPKPDPEIGTSERMMDRAIGGVAFRRPSTIEIAVTEEERVWAADGLRSVPAAPKREFTVSCNVARARPRCSNK